MSEEQQQSETPESQEAEQAHMKMAEVNAEPRGQLHVPDMDINRAHFDNVPRARHEPSQRARRLSRSEWNARQNQRQTIAAMHRPPSPERIPLDPSGGNGDMVQYGWFEKLYRLIFREWPY